MTALDDRPSAASLTFGTMALVPAAAVGEWLALQLALLDAGVPPACAGDPESWWSPGRTPDEREDQAMAARACGSCWALGECRAYALAARERHGVWGGLTPRERRAAVAS